MDLAALNSLDRLLGRRCPPPAHTGLLELRFTDDDAARVWHNHFYGTFRWFHHLPDWPRTVVEPPEWVNEVVAVLRALDRSMTAAPPGASAAYANFLDRRWALGRRDLTWELYGVDGQEVEVAVLSARLADYDPGWLAPVRAAVEQARTPAGPTGGAGGPGAPAAERTGSPVPGGVSGAGGGRKINVGGTEFRFAEDGTEVWVGAEHFPRLDPDAALVFEYICRSHPKRVTQAEIRAAHPHLNVRIADHIKKLPKQLRALID